MQNNRSHHDLAPARPTASVLPGESHARGLLAAVSHPFCPLVSDLTFRNSLRRAVMHKRNASSLTKPEVGYVTHCIAIRGGPS